MEPGRYYIGANRAYTWDKSSTSWFSKDLTEGEGCDESVPVRYNDGGTARVSGSVRYTIGYNETSKETKQKSRKQFTKLHIQYRDQDNFRDRAIQPLVTEVLTLTSTLMSAEESYTTNKAQFTEWALDQLNHGVYLVETYTDTIVLSTGEKKQVRKSKLKIKQGTKNEIMRKEYALKDFDVKFTQFVISDPEYHQSIKDQITGKLTNLMGKVASIAEAELNAAKETTAIAVGQRNVVKSEYEQKVVNVTDIIQSEINAAKERIPAEARNKVSSILKEAAEYQRDADIYDGEGEASYKMALQKADSNMEVRLKLWLIGHQSRAAIIAKNGKITPDFVLPEGTQVDTGMALINYDIMKRASSK
ncbi:hypothetical protein KAU09_01310 [Candidatus Parcubacteria bacterium]|nr:hypothetical protein [Candidatus Parcubacteria bacterium]